MIRIQDLDEAQFRRFAGRAQHVPKDVTEFTRQVIARIQREGDVALRDFTWRLDGVDLDHPWLPMDEWEELAAMCPPDVQQAIDGNLRRIRSFHELQSASEQSHDVIPGVTLGRRPIPAEAAACYVPGGRASYPSTVLMTVTPARIAGVPDVVVVTPPQQKGRIDPAVAYAAKAAGATAILRAGGAQAIAALAIGTETIDPVEVIVGPGNAYVTAAKVALQDRVRIDAPAGPSELLILADKSAKMAHIAADMVAQAEHAPDAQVILVTDNRGLATKVQHEIKEQAEGAKRSKIIQQSLATHGAILVAKDWKEAIRFSNHYAPEHLEIVSKNPRSDMDQIRNAGSVFLGPFAPVSLGDYGSGTNHVLPTMGYARLTGGLSVDHFRKWITWQDVTKEGLRAISNDVICLAEAEGLHGHAEAVRRRL